MNFTITVIRTISGRTSGSIMLDPILIDRPKETAI